MTTSIIVAIIETPHGDRLADTMWEVEITTAHGPKHGQTIDDTLRITVGGQQEARDLARNLEETFDGFADEVTADFAPYLS